MGAAFTGLDGWLSGRGGGKWKQAYVPRDNGPASFDGRPPIA
jgi:hypothetical protein